MITRAEYLYSEAKAKRIDDAIFHFEAGQVWQNVTDPMTGETTGSYVKNSLYSQWEEYISLTPQEQDELEREWNGYYKKCANTTHGKAFFAMKPALTRNDMAFVKKLASESKAAKFEAITQPSGTDPTMLKIRMQPYFELKNTLRKLKTLVEEYKPVYGKKGGMEL